MASQLSDVAKTAVGVEQTTITGPTNASKPHLVFGATPVDGHTYPLIRIAEDLVQRGSEVTFIAVSPKLMAEREAITAGIPRLLYDIRHIFTGQTPERWRILKGVLEGIRADDPEREVVVMPETCFMGANPISLGGPLPKGYTKRPKVINLNPIPYMATSIDTAPFGPGLPPDSTESGRARNQFMNQMMVGGPFADVIAHQEEVLKSLGATEILEPQIPFHHWMLMHDLSIQMCPPSCATPKPMPADFNYPSWWDDVKRGDRRIIAVTQGTIARDAINLIIPTIKALSDRDDLLVVAILGQRGAFLPDDITIPSNTRVIDYLPYDALLPHASVFVMNAGYGGFLHGVTNGVPLVLAGETEDKPEIAMRGAWSGVAVNLKTGRPTPDMVRSGVERILADDSFKKRVDEIKAENEAMKFFDFIEEQVLSVESPEHLNQGFIVATSKTSPLAFMNALSPAVAYFRPDISTSATVKSTTSGDPPLIIILSWSEARDIHIAKYISQYRELYPTSAILLFRASTKLYIQPALRRRLFEPALPILQWVDTKEDDAPNFLIHIFSNGGVSSAATLWEIWETSLNGKPIPRYAVVMDSCPGYFHWKRDHHVLSTGIPPFLSPVVWVFLVFAWVYYKLCLLGVEPHTAYASTLNTPGRISRETMRAYLYGDADLSVGWEDVESHAQQAKDNGAVVRTEKFAGGAHVAHVRVDADRYWKAVQETWQGKEL
ncbi:n-glycosyltransferase [Fusarium phyllophilum]|uniref:N-glycosyltransferase n=1 Tax=Fusarium phyllophilum TaxID=47803 RepID=A0A8H5ML44_9HYPO|nr:n-glycosyltransferase [Fusarium phyllophilum]